MNNTHSFRIGDRFRFYTTDVPGYVVEYVGPDNKWYILEGLNKGNYGKFNCTSSDYEYLGNFNKSENYNNLFKLLNDE